MSQQTTHVHKKKRSTLRRKDSGHKAFPTRCSSVASGRGSLKRAHHLKAINKARLPPALFIGLPDLHVIKLLFVLTGVNPRTRFLRPSQGGQKQIPPDDAHVCCRLRVDRDWIKTVERIFPRAKSSQMSWRCPFVGATSVSKTMSCAQI